MLGLSCKHSVAQLKSTVHLLLIQLQCIVLHGPIPPGVQMKPSAASHTGPLYAASSPCSIVSFRRLSPISRQQVLRLPGLAPPIGLPWLASQKQCFTPWNKLSLSSGLLPHRVSEFRASLVSLLRSPAHGGVCLIRALYTADTRNPLCLP